ncbi:beta-glucosidase [Kovacikia minuta CCNUW1]|uniref:glycoside hydrolase family 3 N-terminal domain-containing protein n=1 Tax=Kovacikia minuta TaxID=2931930 RepID=UPI001CCBDC61|nr:glycoside hydrolase family 3 N-terminal domain-containing protein [Kovacikia minuta]UBF26871.1 beta-glucosidase [Kovacikia minuta CCNUW1]
MTPLLPDIDSLSLKEQIAQMMVVRASGYLFNHQIQYPAWEPRADVLQFWLQELGVGGVILLGGSAGELALRTHQLQSWSKIPLLLAADIEEGVGQRFSGATWFPPPLALAAIAQQHPHQAEQYAVQMGATTAQEARAIGLNWVLAPVVDVNNNPNNPVINVRAWGETPEIVSRLATAFIQGAQRHPVLTAAKHFPGHGDTAVDSHLELPVLDHSLERLYQIEIPPFKAAIVAGVDAVMSAHLQIPALDADYPATLSHRILTQELRQKMGFEGLIVTDALVMGAIANQYGANQAAVLAVEAGVDILMMPLDPPGAIDAVVAAVDAGRIAPERIRASVERIWKAKQKVASPTFATDTSHAWETLPPAIEAHSITTQLAQPDATNTVSEILQNSMQIRCPSSSWLNPSDKQNAHRNLIIVDDVLGCDFLTTQAPAIAIPQSFGYPLQRVDRHTPEILQKPDSTDHRLTLLQLFIRGNPFRGSAGLTQTAKDWFQYLLKTDQLHALVIYGNPYILEEFLATLPSPIPYVFTYGQMPAAQTIALKALFEQQLKV